MMHTQTVARPADTWRDLRALGFDRTLTLADDDGEPPRAMPPPVVAVAPAACAPGAPADAATHVARADELYTAGAHAESLRSALAALGLNASHVDAHRAAGRALHALGRMDAAERSWARAAEIETAAGGRGPTSDEKKD